MGFFKTLFGGKEETAEEIEEKKQENNFDVLKFDGYQAMRIGQTDYAIACLEHALDIHDDEEARRFLATAYVHNDDLESAVEQYAALCAMNVEEAAYPLEMAELLFQLERYEEMTNACCHALEIDDSLAMPHYLLAKRNWAQDMVNEAIEETTKALRIKEDYHEARLLQAQALCANHQYEQSNAELDWLLDKDYHTDEVLMQKAKVCAAMKQFDDAILYYNKVIKQNPFIPVAYVELSGLQKQLGRETDAQRTLDEAVEQLGVSPDDAHALKTDISESVEDYMRNAYNALNPYQLNVNL